jgi:hypothetical protein
MAKKASAIKMPALRTLFYNSNNLSSTGWTDAGKINIIRDLAAVNRHNMTHTSSKGVPYVLRCAVTTSCKPVGGQTYNQMFGEDENLVQVAEIVHASNSWVTRNAFVKAHAARENMFKQQGVLKSERGAYSRTIRPTWTAAPDTFLTPLKGTGSGGSAYDMGTWDYSALESEASSMSHMRLIGDDSIPSVYLDSRKQISADSNSDSDSTDQPVDTNLLRNLLSPTLGVSAKSDEVTALARDEQDNPPYSLDNDGDHTDPVLAGRHFVGARAGLTHTAVYDIPLGLFAIYGLNCYSDSGSNQTIGMNIKVEVLGIYEM